MSKEIQAIERLLEQSPMGVAQVYQKYGINMRPNVDNTLNAIAEFGEPFLMELFNIYHAEHQFLGIRLGKKKPATTAGGDSTAKAEDGKEKKNLWQKFKGIFTKGKEVAGSVSDDAKAITDSVNKTSESVGDTTEVVKGVVARAKTKAEIKEEEEKKKKEAALILGMSPTVFYLLVFVVILLIGLFFYFQSQDKK